MDPASFSEIKIEKKYVSFFKWNTKNRNCVRASDIGKRKSTIRNVYRTVKIKKSVQKHG